MRIQNKMNNDENILWQGRMALIKVLMRAFLNEALILLILYGVFLRYFLKCIKPQSWGLYAMLFMLIPVGIYLCNAFYMWMKARCTEYMVTDKAVYIKSGVITTTVEMKPYIDIAHVNEITSFADKVLHTGTVTFDCWNDRSDRAFAIRDISEYEKVFAFINEHQQKAFRE